ncbi:6-carboxytetrahydropterin synthase QueD [Candidatus Gracilibacteria bacterium]|nr:6-carboxytetrahydropterin synthase QueD [Candidatus Gracilibacteria bacterium]
MFVTKEFTFHASHFLTKYYGRCERLHGHSYKLEVTVEGDIGENDMVIDFGILKRIVVRRVIDKLDHHHLNDLFENPSAERVCEWIWSQLESFSELLKEEVSDPNITEGMRKFLMDGEKIEVENVKKETNLDIRLYEVRLWETEGSSVSKRADS